jgi:hypothetical protein
MAGVSENPNTVRGTVNLKFNRQDIPRAVNVGAGLDWRPDYTDQQYYVTFRYDF